MDDPAQGLTDQEMARLLGDKRLDPGKLVFALIGVRVYHNDGDGWYLLDAKEATIDATIDGS